MAIRQVRTLGDDILYKKCKPVKDMTPRLAQLIEPTPFRYNMKFAERLYADAFWSQ